jgi:hypothetical protein
MVANTENQEAATMRPGRYIRQLNDQERAELRQLYRQTKDADVRSRCQMILLSGDGHRVAEIAKLTLFDENSVLFWFDRYEAEGLAGLEDRPKSGRPPKSRYAVPGSVASSG